MTCSRQHFCEYSLAFLVCLIPAEEKDSPVGFESFNLGMTSFFLPPPPHNSPFLVGLHREPDLRALNPTDKSLVTSQARLHL